MTTTPTPVESLFVRKAREAYEEALVGCARVLVFCAFTGVLFVLGPSCCACLWGIMIACLLLMAFLGQHFLWILVAAAFVVTFWAGCQVDYGWVVVDTHHQWRR